MLSFLKDVFSIFRNKPSLSTDILGVYPLKVHVRALPERRYLKTSRFLVICCLISILFNFALCFIYMRNIDLVETHVYHPYSLNTFLYSLDYYNKELKPIERHRRIATNLDLILQNLITDFLTLRYDLVPNLEEMNRRWSPTGRMASYLTQKQMDAMKGELSEKYSLLRKGMIQKVYIYSIKSLNNNDFYEAVFDVFSLKQNVYGAQSCQCFITDQECLQCLQKNSVGVRRYKAYMRLRINLHQEATQQMRETENPYQFQVKDYYVMEYRYIPRPESEGQSNKKQNYSVWEDVNNILE